MDKQKMKVAVTSSDGIVVNQHFGHTSKFYIYEVDDEIEFLEIRDVVPACDKGNHNDEHLRRNAEVISDCDYLLASRIGNGAANILEQLGIEVYEIPGVILESIEQLIKFIKINELFKEKGI